MRSYLVFLMCLGLTGCVNYIGMKGHSKSLSSADLAKHHTYQLQTATAKLAPTDWWGQFHDPLLNQLIQVALQDSPTMLVAENRLRKANYLAKAAETNLWPSVDMSGYIQRQRFSTFGLAPPPFNGRTFNIGELGLNFNYELDFWGKNRNLLAAEVSEACAAMADLAQARLLLAGSVTLTYFRLQNSIAQVKIARDTYHIKRELLAIVKARAKKGLQSDIPVKTNVSDVESARIELNQYLETEKLARNQLAVLLGKNPFKTNVFAKHFSYRKKSLMLPKRLSANLLGSRPDVLAARLRTEAAAYQINVAKARFFPDVNLIGLFSFQGVDLNHVFLKTSQNNAITGAIDLPIFDAGLRRANLGMRFAEYDQAVNQYNETILVALREVKDQLSILQTLKNELSAQQISLSAINHNYKLARLRYKQGVVDYTEVLQRKESLLQQEAKQINLETRHLQAVAELVVALGGNNFTERGKL